MSPHDAGVAELLRRASDDLAPDVDRLVSGGIARGRSRRRRARIGTTLASLAAVGVVGGLAVVVPRLDADPVSGDPVAGDPPVATETPASVPRELAAFRVLDVPAMVNTLVGSELGTAPRGSDRWLDEGDAKFVAFPYDGMHTSVGINGALESDIEGCEDEAVRLEGTCEVLPDGTILQSWGPSLADGVTCQGVTTFRHGFAVWATSCNAAEAKDSPPLAPRPPLGLEQLRTVVLSEVWFE